MAKFVGTQIWKSISSSINYGCWNRSCCCCSVLFVWTVLFTRNTRITSFCIRNCYWYQFLMPNGTTFITIYPAFDIHDKNQGREGLRGNFLLLSIWGGRWVDGKNFFLGGRGGGWPPKTKEGYPSLNMPIIANIKHAGNLQSGVMLLYAYAYLSTWPVLCWQSFLCLPSCHPDLASFLRENEEV